jgi:hypothetical protein
VFADRIDRRCGRAGHDAVHRPRPFSVRDGVVPGVDPFLEDDAFLWLLHYQMVANAPLSTWSMMLNHYNKPAFRKKDAGAFKMAEASVLRAALLLVLAELDVKG